MKAPPPTPDPASAPAGARRTTFRPVATLALGALLSLLFAGLGTTQALFLHRPFDLRNVLTESLARWMLYAILAPAVGAVVARAPLARQQGGRRILAHFGVTLGCALLHTVLVASVYGLLRIYPRGSSLGEAIGRLALLYFGVNLVIFWAIDGAYHALRYHDEVRVREQLAAELRAQLSLAQLDRLRAQLNPHFLFNTLNTISTLALTGKNEQVVHTLSRLGDLLRVSLDRELPQEISVSREIEFLRGYLEIQQVRFGDRLSFDLRIAPEAETRLLPSMLLQPLVENAIQHGLAARPGPGRVVVRVSPRAELLCVRVEDDGPGFGADSGTGDGHGIGLENTRSRLAQLYGEGASLEFGSLESDGGFVQVLLPSRVAGAGADAA